MATIGLAQLRRVLDDAITYADFDEARRLADTGLRIAREKDLLGEIMYFQAQGEIIDENYGEAVRFLDLAIKFNPKDGAAYNDRALCMVELGKTQEALPYFDKGIEVEPDYATIYHNKGWLLNTLGQHRQAIVLFEQTLRIEPDRAVTYENLANAYECLGHIPHALEAYKKALALLKPPHKEFKKQIKSKIKKLENT